MAGCCLVVFCVSWKSDDEVVEGGYSLPQLVLCDSIKRDVIGLPSLLLLFREVGFIYLLKRMED